MFRTPDVLSELALLNNTNSNQSKSTVHKIQRLVLHIYKFIRLAMYNEYELQHICEQTQLTRTSTFMNKLTWISEWLSNGSTVQSDKTTVQSGHT